MSQYNNYAKPQPDWDKINGEKRFEIIKGQTANQLVEILVTRMQIQKVANFEEFLKEYESIPLVPDQ